MTEDEMKIFITIMMPILIEDSGLKNNRFLKFKLLNKQLQLLI